MTTIITITAEEIGTIDNNFYDYSGEDRILKNILLTTDKDYVFEILGLKKEVWYSAGFNTLEDIFEYIKSLNKGYFGMDDIIKDNFLIRRYIHNLEGNNIYLYNDFEKEFLSNTNLDNKSLEQIMVILESKESKISNTEENYHRMKKVWDGLFL